MKCLPRKATATMNFDCDKPGIEIPVGPPCTALVPMRPQPLPKCPKPWYLKSLRELDKVERVKFVRAVVAASLLTPLLTLIVLCLGHDLGINEDKVWDFVRPIADQVLNLLGVSILILVAVAAYLILFLFLDYYAFGSHARPIDRTFLIRALLFPVKVLFLVSVVFGLPYLGSWLINLL